ncbi:MAG: rod-binding protein [Dongiaceae bacterium]
MEALTTAANPFLQPPAKPARAEIAKVAKEYEAIFASQMLEHMFSGIKTDGLFGGGHTEGVYRSLLMQEYGKTLAQNGKLGIADAMQRELLQIQESVNGQR